jgi:hypothetical protein
VTLRPYSQGELLGRREDFVSWAFSSAPPPPLALAPADLPELIEEILAWSTNAGKRIARRPKMLVSDTGLAAALVSMTAATWNGDRPLATKGPLLESFVALELRKQLGWSATPATHHHYREHDGAEVDLLLEARDGGVVGIEVKASHRMGRDTVRHLEGLPSRPRPGGQRASLAARLGRPLITGSIAGSSSSEGTPPRSQRGACCAATHWDGRGPRRRSP